MIKWLKTIPLGLLFMALFYVEFFNVNETLKFIVAMIAVVYLLIDVFFLYHFERE